MTDEKEALRELMDRQRIAEVIARYCERLDEYDIDGVVTTFTEDVVTDYGAGRGGEVTGRQAVRDRIAVGQSTFRRTSHQLGQSRVSFSGKNANAITYVTAWHEWLDGRKDVLRLRYIDVLRQSQNGQWLISERRVEAMGVDGFEGVEWNWVNRANPEQSTSTTKD